MIQITRIRLANFGFEIKDFNPVNDIDPYAYELERKGAQTQTPYFTTIDKLLS